jgi:uncharacterized cupin superfamily protein
MSENDIIVLDTNTMEWSELSNGKSIYHKRKDITRDLTSNKLVVSIYEVPPGKVSWPFHYHAANEEVFLILEGEGELRTLNQRIQVKAGDFMRFPPGKNGAHQLKNTSQQLLRYMDIGTAIHPDITVMPDSNKIGVMAGSAPSQSKAKRYISRFFKINTETDFFADEI